MIGPSLCAFSRNWRKNQDSRLSSRIRTGIEDSSEIRTGREDGQIDQSIVRITQFVAKN